MRIAICEDSKSDADHLYGLLTCYLKNNNLSANIDFFESGESFLLSFEPEKYQIIFMDIMLKNGCMNGMDTAEKIVERDISVALIFTTNNDSYSIAGYAVAVYYILKPVAVVDFERAMKKCRVILEKYDKTIQITVNRETLSIRLRDIYYIESQQRNCVFMTAHGEYTATMVLSSLEEKLGGMPFVQCHRSYFVNLTHVTDLQGKDFIVTGKNKIPISKPLLADMQKKFKQFLREEIKGNII